MNITQTIRVLVAYPLMFVCGLAWMYLYLLRWRKYKTESNIWAALLGLSVALFGISSTIAIWIANTRGGFSSQTTGWIITSSTAFIAIFLLVAVIRLVYKGMQNGKKQHP